MALHNALLSMTPGTCRVAIHVNYTVIFIFSVCCLLFRMIEYLISIMFAAGSFSLTHCVSLQEERLTKISMHKNWCNAIQWDEWAFSFLQRSLQSCWIVCHDDHRLYYIEFTKLISSYCVKMCTWVSPPLLNYDHVVHAAYIANHGINFLIFFLILLQTSEDGSTHTHIHPTSHNTLIYTPCPSRQWPESWIPS